MKRDCSNIVERLPKHEERAGVTLKGTYAEAEQDDQGWQINVRGEIHATVGDELSQPTEVVATLLDGSERVLDTTSTYLDEETFFEFETFDFAFFDIDVMPTKIRIHPKRV